MCVFENEAYGNHLSRHLLKADIWTQCFFETHNVTKQTIDIYTITHATHTQTHARTHARIHIEEEKIIHKY